MGLYVTVKYHPEENNVTLGVTVFLQGMILTNPCVIYFIAPNNNSDDFFHDDFYFIFFRQCDQILYC
jgi:hypothetical protein